MAKTPKTILKVAGREVAITNPDKVYFPKAGYTKVDLAKYYLAVAEGALRGIGGRPIVLKRYVDGAEGEPFFQKRALRTASRGPGLEHSGEPQSRSGRACCEGRAGGGFGGAGLVEGPI